MRPKCLRLALLALMLAVLATAACADTVVVSPANPGDWSWMFNSVTSGQRAYFTKGGPAPAEGNPFPTGNGGFYAALTYNGEDGETTPDTAWIGLDRHNGQPLAGIILDQITKLEYTAYNAGNYVAYMGGQIRYAKQPFQLSISVVCPTTGDRRQFLFRPWGLDGFPHWNNRRAWLTLDAINMQSTPNFGSLTPVWFELWTGQTFNSWTQILNTDPGGGRPLYADWALVSTSTYYDPTHADPAGWKSPGWDGDSVPAGDPRCTGTGKPINLTVGIRDYYGQPYTAYESFGFKGCVDTFTLGINYAQWPDEDIHETTYDFASDDPAPYTVNICNIGASLWKANPPWDYPYATNNPTVRDQDKFLRRVTGQVLDLTGYGYGPDIDPDTKEFYFTIWDGSPAPVSSAQPDWRRRGLVQVRWPWQDSPAVGSDWSTWPVQIGDYVSVTGYFYGPFYFQVKPPAECTSNAANTQVLVPAF